MSDYNLREELMKVRPVFAPVNLSVARRYPLIDSMLRTGRPYKGTVKEDVFIFISKYPLK